MWHQSFHFAVFGLAILAITSKVLIGSVVDYVVVIQELEELEIRSSDCKLMT